MCRRVGGGGLWSIGVLAELGARTRGLGGMGTSFFDAEVVVNAIDGLAWGGEGLRRGEGWWLGMLVGRGASTAHGRVWRIWRR